jgi:orotate phosphoribosyltransferase
MSLLAARRGHFRFESGHHGDLWLDVPRLFVRPSRLRPLASALAQKLAAHGPDLVCGPMVEGALLAQTVAMELDVEFCFAEQGVRPDPSGLFPVSYRIPDVLRAGIRGKRAAIVDDVINAGSAVRGAFSDLQACGAYPVALGSLLVLGVAGPAYAASQDVALESLGFVENNLWEPAQCPLCASGIRLEGVPDPQCNTGG